MLNIHFDTQESESGAERAPPKWSHHRVLGVPHMLHGPAALRRLLELRSADIRSDQFPGQNHAVLRRGQAVTIPGSNRILHFWRVQRESEHNLGRVELSGRCDIGGLHETLVQEAGTAVSER